jgi:hypothetical protein
LDHLKKSVQLRGFLCEAIRSIAAAFSMANRENIMSRDKCKQKKQNSLIDGFGAICDQWETILEQIPGLDRGSDATEEEHPAFAYLFGDDPVAMLRDLHLRGELEQECEDGKIVVSDTHSV